ncbi:MAG TPA: hypothetical protein VGL65_07755 [Gemmatimonadales bacterium]|jgi:hypothetical protein
MSTKGSQFPDSLLRAINDWQCGGDLNQKRKRGARLKTECASLPAQYKTTFLVCFRQLALKPAAVWELHSNLCLAETISAWTLSTGVAREIKGGVSPDPQVPGLILEIVPPPSSIIVNLDALYREPAFVAAHQAAKSRIRGYYDGIDKYGDTQCEVVLELDSVPMSAAYALGGHSSDAEDIPRLLFGHNPSKAELDEFGTLLARSDQKLGPRWIVGAAKDRVLQRTLIQYGVMTAPAERSQDTQGSATKDGGHDCSSCVSDYAWGSDT